MNQESYDTLIALSPSARVELSWWLKHTLNTNGIRVHLPPPDMIITTDASKKGWGAVHQSLQINSRWSQKESLQHINYPELKASFLALKSLSQRQVSCNRISAARQHDRRCLHQQQRWYTFPPTYDSGLRDLGLLSGKSQPCDSFSLPRKGQRLSKQGVQRIQGHERVEVGPNNHPAFSAELSDGSVCESSNQPTRGLHQLETRPRSHPHRRLHDKLGSSTGLCLRPLQSDIRNPDEGKNRPNGNNSRCPSLASPALVASSAETSNISASVATEQSNPVNGPDRPETSSSNVSSPSLGRISHLYRCF